jgi:hypothetical protein
MVNRDAPCISGQYVLRQPSRSGLGCPETCRLELFGEPLLICRGLSSIAFPEAPETGA